MTNQRKQRTSQEYLDQRRRQLKAEKKVIYNAHSNFMFPYQTHEYAVNKYAFVPEGYIGKFVSKHNAIKCMRRAAQAAIEEERRIIRRLLFLWLEHEGSVPDHIVDFIMEIVTIGSSGGRMQKTRADSFIKPYLERNPFIDKVCISKYKEGEDLELQIVLHGSEGTRIDGRINRIAEKIHNRILPIINENEETKRMYSEYEFKLRKDAKKAMKGYTGYEYAEKMRQIVREKKQDDVD